MACLTSNQVCNICKVHRCGLGPSCLGCNIEGGYVYNVSGRIAWIIAPSATQVSRNWYCREHAVTCAEGAAACGDWFIPTSTELLKAVVCYQYWDSITNSRYGSHTYAGPIGYLCPKNNIFVCGGFSSFGSLGYVCCATAATLQCWRAIRKVYY